ncbi:MAG: hypothetical protein MPJ78_17905 [Hyphomicrobiaceae bacterium]|nr:hypothetical protein [Hyphomicrobiaceae bacterium]
MRRALLTLSTVALSLLAAAPDARASACANDQYLHNGSIMDVQICDGGRLAISYSQPRAGIAKAGAQSGSLLFDGVEGAGGAISGQSRLFSARCGVVSYPVSGSRQGNMIVLRGTAPVRGRRCQVVRYRQDNLVFSPLATAPAPTPQCPPGYSFINGQCIRSGAGPAPGPGGGGWYAIAGSFANRAEAQTRAARLGNGWFIMNTTQCSNFRNGFWIATAGPLPRGQAQALASTARRFGAYAKSCR